MSRRANLHLLGICGTFMGGLALLARTLGHRVSGSDEHVYPPMSTQLTESGIKLYNGYLPQHIEADCDLVVIGNALSRGNRAVEHVLNQNLPYTSGAQWLSEHLLQSRRVAAVAGTHGKTTTAAMLAWLLEQAGLAPGFLIGGVPENFGQSARTGDGDWFVIEADEYDTAFFDKRAKFVHYRPRVAILNNLEFDHADIYPDLAAIQTQFHHLVRTVPGCGSLIVNAADRNLAEVLGRGCWTEQSTFAGDGQWQNRFLVDDHSRFELVHGSDRWAGQWQLSGQHNLDNATAAVAAAWKIGVEPGLAVEALTSFTPPKRRQQVLTRAGDRVVLDDFAHHPTAIAATLSGLRARFGGRRLIAVVEPRSNSMRSGAHNASLAQALDGADLVLLAEAGQAWDANQVLHSLQQKLILLATTDSVPAAVIEVSRPGDCIVFMSNGGFGGAPAATARQLSDAYD